MKSLHVCAVMWINSWWQDKDYIMWSLETGVEVQGCLHIRYNRDTQTLISPSPHDCNIRRSHAPLNCFRICLARGLVFAFYGVVHTELHRRATKV